MQSADKEAIDVALSGIASALNVDGYALDSSLHDGRLRLRIMAGPSACADCLIPPDLMEQMILAELGHHGLEPVEGISLIYPSGAHGE